MLKSENHSLCRMESVDKELLIFTKIRKSSFILEGSSLVMIFFIFLFIFVLFCLVFFPAIEVFLKSSCYFYC